VLRALLSMSSNKRRAYPDEPALTHGGMHEAKA
jgi:hypothetical protein